MPVIGLISDTHGLLRPQAVAALEGSDHIVHAGDIMDPAILEQLARIAPVTAVRGNNDHGTWAEAIPETAVLQVEATVIYAIHDLADLDVDPVAAGFHVVVSGHSHKPASALREGVWFVNPGSAGPRRFTLPISVGRLRIEGGAIKAELIELPLR
jgi:putative phosphoesterase